MKNERLIELALQGLEVERDRVEREIAMLRQQPTSRKTRRRAGQPAGATPRAKSGGITAAGRKKLSDMMRARWAAKRKAAAGRTKRKTA